LTKKTKIKPARLFLDTTAIRYLTLHDTRFRHAVEGHIEAGQREISTFVRMEFFRGVIIILIDCYFILKRFRDVETGLHYLSSEFSVAKKTLVVQTAIHWLQGYPASSKAATLRRLGNKIVDLVRCFENLDVRMCRDYTRCELGKMRFPDGPFNEDQLMAFRERFSRTRKKPNCNLCVFREKHCRSLARQGIDLCGEKTIKRYKDNKQFTNQAERLAEAEATRADEPSCWWCERLGDSIIALNAHRNHTIVSSDRSFGPLCELLQKGHKRLPSVRKLYKSLMDENS